MAIKNDILKLMRERAGLTQEAFAVLLKMSRSQLNMAEAGKRKLPGSASIITGKMVSYFNAIAAGELANYRSPETRLFLNQEYNKVIPKIQAKEKDCRFQVKKLKFQLAIMKEKARNSEEWIIVITRLIDDIKDDPKPGREMEWLLLLRQQAYHRLLTCWEPKQTSINIQIEVMASEARALRRYRLKLKRASN